MFKKVICWLFIITLGLTLFSCGKTSSEKSSKEAVIPTFTMSMIPPNPIAYVSSLHIQLKSSLANAITPSTVTANNITVTVGSTKLASTLSVKDNIITIIPTGLKANTSYTVTVKGLTDVAGNSLAEMQSFYSNSGSIPKNKIKS